ncbi:MAG: lycopene cyclase domain-containing protein [Acidimicrobiales bacterium]
MTGLYTLSALAAALAVVGAEVCWLHTGLFARRTYWVTMAIVVFFQVLVDGWLTKRSSPIVIYNEAQFSGLRFPFDIPVEDFVYGFALVSLTLLLWVRATGERA